LKQTSLLKRSLLIRLFTTKAAVTELDLLTPKVVAETPAPQPKSPSALSWSNVLKLLDLVAMCEIMPVTAENMDGFFVVIDRVRVLPAQPFCQALPVGRDPHGKNP
jgi:hypothetical protein